MGALLLLLLLAMAPVRGDWEANSIVTISRSIARGEDLADGWICHSNPLAGDPQPKLVPFGGNVTLILLREQDPPNKGPLLVDFPPDASLPCVHLNPPFVPSTQPPLPKVTVPLRCYRDSASCCHCSRNKPIRPACLPPREQGMGPVNVSAITPLFDQDPCSHNLTHWCPSSPDADGRCLPWSGSTLGGAPRSDCAHLPPWGLQLEEWLGRGRDHYACAPHGFVFLCTTRDGTWAHACLGSTAKSSQKCILARVQRRGTGPVVHKGALARPARDGALLLEALRARLAQPAPSSPSHEAPRADLRAAPLDSEGEVLALQASFESLVDMVLDNQLAVDYFLAEKAGVCALINGTCCIYVNPLGEVETDPQQIYEQASLRLHNQAPGPAASWTTEHVWVLPLTSLLVTIVLVLVFGFCLFQSVKLVFSEIQHFLEKLMVAQEPLLDEEPELPTLSPVD